MDRLKNTSPLVLVCAGLDALTAIIRACGERAGRCCIEFFTARKRSPNCRADNFGSSLATDLMLICVFVVVDVAIPFDNDFDVLAQYCEASKMFASMSFH